MSGDTQGTFDAKVRYMKHEKSDVSEKLSAFLENIWNLDEQTLTVSILISFLVILVTIFVFYVKRKSSRGNNILLLGLSNSGKTLLFSKLVLNQARHTLTSLKENQGSFTYVTEKGPKNIKIVDIPGYESIRLKYFEQFIESAKAIVFLVDSASFQKDIKDVAEFMHTVLVSVVGIPLSILVACNKQDVATAKGSALIKSALEKELNQVRQTQSAALQGVDGKFASTVFLGSRRRDFTFADLKKNIDFVEFSAKREDNSSLEEVQKWMADLK